MTLREAKRLAKRVEDWQHRLEPLGVGHFRIEGVYFVEDPPGKANARASVRPHPTYDTVEFWFRISFIEATDVVSTGEQELDETIIHEWLHVAMRGLDQSIEAIEDSLGQPALDLWEGRVDYEREGLVDRLTRQIWVLWAADKNATPATLRRLDHVSLRSGD